MAGAIFGLLVLVLLVGLPIFIWFFCRIEPEAGQIAVLIRKTGRDLPSGQILALEAGQKGIQLDVLAEGRYFRNPYTWGWTIGTITDIPAGKLGVVTRLYGDSLPPGEIIAKDGCKGILAEPLRPGKYRLNPYAFRVDLHDAITVRPGSVGVKTSLVGKDVLSDNLPDADRNQFLVQEGMKGVQREVLDPGTYYLNPYTVSTVEVNLQSQRFEMSGEDVITFLTQDGFTVRVEGTIEFSIQREHAALITHRVGDMDDVVKKVILPRARGFSRIEGSKHPAINFIVGETRQQFQNSLEGHLREKSKEWGVSVNSVLIRNILPPDQIASIIREREVAVQDARKFEQQILQAKSKAELTRQEMLALQNREKVVADTAQIRAVILAQQEADVQVIAANQAMAVAKLENEAAEAQVAAMLAKAGAEQEVIRLNNEAEAGVINDQVKAFGDGFNMATHALYRKLAPNIGAVISGDQAGGIGGVFQEFSKGEKK